MTDTRKVTAIDILSASLAEVTRHAQLMEAEAKEANDRAENWFRHWSDSENRAKAAEEKLAKITEKLETLEGRLRKYIDMHEQTEAAAGEGETLKREGGAVNA